MNVDDALDAQSVGSIERQLGNAVRAAKSRNRVIALSPATLTHRYDRDRGGPQTVSLSHHYYELEAGQLPPDGWVIVDGEEVD
jgi:hypothetical protein